MIVAYVEAEKRTMYGTALVIWILEILSKPGHQLFKYKAKLSQCVKKCSV